MWARRYNRRITNFQGLFLKSIHLGADLLAVSAVLAGIRRNTGLTPDLDQIPNESARYYTKKYLGLGELVLDTSSAFMSQSEFFKRS